jgi:SAM-dependent methyltransferase
VHCPVCETEQPRFEAYNQRDDARCTACGAFERHRQLWVWLERSGVTVGRVLDLAPHRGLGPALERRAASYVSADVAPGRAMRVADICALGDADASYDFICCSHVLEHVADDAAAMRELHRVLAPGGVAVLPVPLRDAPTDEDPACADAAERLRRFGQADHVRRYGWDFFDRLAAAGFAVDPVDIRAITTPDERVRYGLATNVGWIDPDARELWVLPVARRRV